MIRLLIILGIVGGCNASESTGIATVSCPTDSTLTYANFGSAFISNNCLSCHASKQQPNLSTQAQVAAHSSQILNEAVYTKAMPEDNDIAIAEREMLGEWLACGAP